MPVYRVTWEADIMALSPQHAAESVAKWWRFAGVEVKVRDPQFRTVEAPNEAMVVAIVPIPPLDPHVREDQDRDSPYRTPCEAAGWRYYRDHDCLEDITGDRWGIAHKPTVEDGANYNDSVYATWEACYREALGRDDILPSTSP